MSDTLINPKKLDGIIDEALGVYKEGIADAYRGDKRTKLINDISRKLRDEHGDAVHEKIMGLVNKRLDQRLEKYALNFEKEAHWSGTGAFGYNTEKAASWTWGKGKGFAGGLAKYTLGTAAVVAGAVALSNMFKKKPEDAEVSAPDYATQPGFPPVMQPEMMMAPPAPLGMAPDGRPVYGQFSAQAAGMASAPALNPRMTAGNFTDAVQSAGAAPSPLGAA